MKLKNGSVARVQMTSQERNLRSRLQQILRSQALLRGTLLDREVSCGRANCRCAQGAKHPVLCLVVSENGRQRQISVPKLLEAEVRLCVAQYQDLRKRVEELCALYLNKLKQREL